MENRSIVYDGLADVRQELCDFLNCPGSTRRVRQLTVGKFQGIISDATRSLKQGLSPGRVLRGKRGQREAAVAGPRLVHNVDGDGRDGLEYMDRGGVVHECCILREDVTQPGVYEREVQDVETSEQEPWGRDGSTAIGGDHEDSSCRYGWSQRG